MKDPFRRIPLWALTLSHIVAAVPAPATGGDDASPQTENPDSSALQAGVCRSSVRKPLCCHQNSLAGLLHQGCGPPLSEPAGSRAFVEGCGEHHKTAFCCTVNLLGTAVLCQAPPGYVAKSESGAVLNRRQDDYYRYPGIDDGYNDDKNKGGGGGGGYPKDPKDPKGGSPPYGGGGGDYPKKPEYPPSYPEQPCCGDDDEYKKPVDPPCCGDDDGYGKPDYGNDDKYKKDPPYGGDDKHKKEPSYGGDDKHKKKPSYGDDDDYDDDDKYKKEPSYGGGGDYGKGEKDHGYGREREKHYPHSSYGPDGWDKDNFDPFLLKGPDGDTFPFPPPGGWDEVGNRPGSGGPPAGGPPAGGAPAEGAPAEGAPAEGGPAEGAPSAGGEQGGAGEGGPCPTTTVYAPAPTGPPAGGPPAGAPAGPPVSGRPVSWCDPAHPDCRPYCTIGQPGCVDDGLCEAWDQACKKAWWDTHPKPGQGGAPQGGAPSGPPQGGSGGSGKDEHDGYY